MKKYTADKIVEAAWVEMFRRVGVKSENADDCLAWATKHGDKWWEARSWTEEEQDDFKKWLDGFLKKHTRWSAKQRRFETGMFLLMWGWITKESLEARATRDKGGSHD